MTTTTIRTKRIRKIAEHTAMAKELRSSDDTFGLDSGQLETFIANALRKVGKKNLAIAEHGFYIQIDPLVCLFNGRTEALNRTACVAVRDDANTDGLDVITFPKTEVLEFPIPADADLDEAVKRSLAQCRKWALSAPDRRLGSFVRLHIIPDAKAPDGARTVLCVERLTNTEA